MCERVFSSVCVFYACVGISLFMCVCVWICWCACLLGYFYAFVYALLCVCLRGCFGALTSLLRSCVVCFCVAVYVIYLCYLRDV